MEAVILDFEETTDQVISALKKNTYNKKNKSNKSSFMVTVEEIH